MNFTPLFPQFLWLNTRPADSFPPLPETDFRVRMGFTELLFSSAD
jgi:hypothetical protein